MSQQWVMEVECCNDPYINFHENVAKYHVHSETGALQVECGGIDELLATIDNAIPKPYVPAYGIGPAHTMIVGIGDMQFGKMDGADVYINHVHIAWLGDHVEGFNSHFHENVAKYHVHSETGALQVECGGELTVYSRYDWTRFKVAKKEVE